MRKFILLCFVFSGLYASAQSNYSSSLGLSAGYAEDGYGLMATYNYHLDRLSYIQGSVFASFGKDKGKNYEVPYNIFTIQPGYFYQVLETYPFRKFALNLGGGGIFGYEVINKGRNELENGAVIDADSKFIYGAFIGLEGEVRLLDSFYIILKANEYYHANSDVGKLYPYAGIGFRYFIF